MQIMATSEKPGQKRQSKKKVHTAGIIADTHNLLRPEVLDRLKGSEVILHAGDVGSEDIIIELEKIAPVQAVRGNIDGSSREELPLTQVVEFHGFLIYLLHDLEDLDLDPAAAGFSAVVSGHSHRPSISADNGVLFVNPGSAGPRRFNLPVTMARLHVYEGSVTAELVPLE